MSNKKNILIRIDSSATIGLGHLMRTLLLANQLKGHFSITYATQDLKGNQNHLIEQNGFRHLHLQNMDCDLFSHLVQKLRPRLCIIDHYGIDASCEAKIQKICDLLVFDDTFKKHCANIVLNHSFIAKKRDYGYLKNSTILAGSRYTLLKEGFFSCKDPFTPLGTLRNKKVLITLGGSDPLHLSYKIKRYLLAKEPSLHVRIVTTAANTQLTYLQRVDKELIIDAKDMATLMKQQDLIITSASTSLLETIALKKPFIAIECASNQSQTVDILAAKNLKNVIKDFNLFAFQRALNFVQYGASKIKRVVQSYNFYKESVAKEIIREYK